MPTGLQDVEQPRQLVARQALQAVVRGIGVDLQKQAQVVQHRGNDRGDRDVDVGNLQERRHHEGGRPHDRGHQDAAG